MASQSARRNRCVRGSHFRNRPLSKLLLNISTQPRYGKKMTFETAGSFNLVGLSNFAIKWEVTLGHL